jgi:hypothetical protein
LMIDRQCRLWKADAKMNEFLRPSTLFRPEKFPDYYDNRNLTTGITISKPNHEKGF